MCNCGKQSSAEVKLREFKRVMPFDAVMVDGPEHNSVVAQRARKKVVQLKGCPYTELDNGEYWRGFHLINRTGRYFILPNRFNDWVKKCAETGQDVMDMAKNWGVK
jgi:hypothetical protein